MGRYRIEYRDGPKELTNCAEAARPHCERQEIEWHGKRVSVAVLPHTNHFRLDPLQRHGDPSRWLIVDSQNSADYVDGFETFEEAEAAVAKLERAVA